MKPPLSGAEACEFRRQLEKWERECLALLDARESLPLPEWVAFLTQAGLHPEVARDMLKTARRLRAFRRTLAAVSAN
jgi:hypothetical protein